MYRWCVIVLAVLAAACEPSSRAPLVDSDAALGARAAPRADGLASRPDLQSVYEAAREGRLSDLVAAFSAPDSVVRARAAFEAAGVLGTPSVERSGVLSHLVELLGDEAALVRADAAFALSRAARGEDVVAALKDRLEVEEGAAVRAELYESLGFLGGTDVSLALLDPIGDRVDAREDRVGRTGALARMWSRGVLAPAARDSLVGRLVDPDAGVRLAAARGFSTARGPDVWIRYRRSVTAALDAYGLDDPAARPILRSFGRLVPRSSLERWWRSAEDPRTRRAAVLAVAAHSDGMLGVSDLVAAFDDEHPWVRRAAAMGLGQFAGAEAAMAALEERVGRQPHPVTEQAWLRALAVTGRLDELYDRIEGYDPGDAVGWSAATALLAEVGDPLLLDIVADAESSSSPYVAWLARRATGKALAPPAEALDDGVLPTWTDADWSELGALGQAPRLSLTFPAGEVVVQLDPDQAPTATLYLARLIAAGRFDAASLHRVLPGVLSQWGPPGATANGPPPEPGRIRFDTGVVGWALRGERGDDDLFVALDALPELDAAYTSMGWVVDGLSVWEISTQGEPVLEARILSR